MEYFVVYLKSKRYIAVPKHWIENPTLGLRSTIFFSGNGFNTQADFSLGKKHYINGKVDACYDAFVFKSFHSYEDAQHYALNKRLVAPVQYKTFETFDFTSDSHPVDLIEISDSDTSETHSISNVRLFLAIFK